VKQNAVNGWLAAQFTTNGKKFRSFLAPADFTSMVDAKSLALGFNSSHVHMMYQALVSTGGVTELPPLYQSAMYCGLAAGAPPTVSTTRAVLRGQSLPARSKLTLAQQEDLLNNGVCVLQEVKGVGVRITMGITTSLSPDRVNRMTSESIAIDVIDERIRVYVNPLIPHWAMLDFLPTVKGSVYNALTSLQADGIISEGMDAQYRRLPAFLPATVSIQGGIMNIRVHVFIGGEIDHVNINGTVSYQEFNIQITAGA
jgi:hypothetical protein